MFNAELVLMLKKDYLYRNISLEEYMMYLLSVKSDKLTNKVNCNS